MSTSARAAAAPPTFPRWLTSRYAELLRTYVIMGSGKLAEEMHALAERLVTSGMTAHEALLLHLNVLEDMVQSLGTRSARHVISRADVLVVDLMLHLAEGYRQRSQAAAN